MCHVKLQTVLFLKVSRNNFNPLAALVSFDLPKCAPMCGFVSATHCLKGLAIGTRCSLLHGYLVCYKCTLYSAYLFASYLVARDGATR